MKKLIAISVVFALVAGAAFAAEVSGSVIGTVQVLKGDTSKSGVDEANPVKSGGGMDRIRLEASGENDDSTFGGWIRVDPASIDFSGEGSFGHGFQGIAWWKPIDVLKFSIGGNSDGQFGKEGVTGWMFNQTAADTSVTYCGDNVWSMDGLYGYGLVTRDAFYAGFAGEGAVLNISPAEIVDINIAIPFISGEVVDGKNNKIGSSGGHEAADYFKAAHAQVDFKLEGFNIAVTYMGAPRYFSFGKPWAGGGGVVYGYFGMTMIENLSIDVGFSFQFTNQDDTSNPIAAGLGVKYALDAFGIKLRTVGRFGGEEGEPLVVLADLLPYFNVGDDIRVFVGVGLGMLIPEEGDSLLGWNFNPYLEVGQEWGPKFLAGIKVMSDGIERSDGSKTVKWEVPVALSVGF